MRKIILILILCMIIPLVSAEVETFGTFKQDKCIDLKQSCSNCTYVNITEVLYPNSTQALGNVLMTKIGSSYNYTFCDTQAIGQYIVMGVGDIDGTDTVFSYDFNVNYAGEELNTSKSILYVLMFIFLIALCVTCLYFSVKIQGRNFKTDDLNKIVSYSDLRYLKLALSFFSYLLFMGVIFLGYGLSKNYLFLDGFSRLLWVVFIILLTANLIIVPLLLMTFYLMIVESKTFKNNIERGLPFR